MAYVSRDGEDPVLMAEKYHQALSSLQSRLRQVQGKLDDLISWQGAGGEVLSQTKLHNPLVEFDTPSDVVRDLRLSVTEKKEALETLEQDAHQLMTASNEGMAALSDDTQNHEPKLDEVVTAKSHIGHKPNHKPAQ